MSNNFHHNNLKRKQMKLHLDLIPGKVQHAAAKMTHVGEEIKAALQSGTAIAVEALIDKAFPEAALLRPELIALTDAAIKTCTKIATDDWSGVTARLQRLTADTAMLKHGGKHGISLYIQWVEVVIRDVIGGGSGTNKDADDNGE